MGGGKKKNRNSNPQDNPGDSTSSHSHGEGYVSKSPNTQGNAVHDMTKLTSKFSTLKIKEVDGSDCSSTSREGDLKKIENPSAVSGEEKRRSKEEVIAERKAKAAEAKAKKAAAAAAKKAANINSSGDVKDSAGKQQKKVNNRSAAFGKHTAFSDIEQGSGSSVSRSANDQSKIALAGSSSRLSVPFRHVHFDMTPTTAEEKIRVQPSLSETSSLNVHHAFKDFAVSCTSGHIVGIDAICVAYIHAFKEFLNDYSLVENRSMSHDLYEKTEQHIKYLTESGLQPLPLALQNIVRQLQKEINQSLTDLTEVAGKEKLREWLEDLISQNFDLAYQAISSFCQNKLKNATYIVTYSWCPVVEKIILDAYREQLNFHLCIIDSPTNQRGKKLAKELSAKNIECTYGLLNAVGYVMKQCNMVLLGCSAILSNGYVVADRGSSSVALVASAANVPVLVAAQTFKFADRAQLSDGGKKERSILIEEQKEILPADLVTAVVTELRILHPSSAPAVLKAKQLAVG